MSVALIILCVLAALAALADLFAEYSRVLMMMQQNSYRAERYMRWLRTSGDTTSYPRLLGMMVFFGSMAAFGNHVWGLLLIALFGAVSSIVLLRKKYKKPLVWTPRVRRIFSVMVALSAIVAAGVFMCGYFGGGSIDTCLFYCIVALTGLYCASHIVVLVAVKSLSPVERRINRRYYEEAAAVMASMPALKVVGVTGSYGKTSTKHYLYRILSEQFETLMTPGSYNTTMGVIRTIREMMKPYCEVFVCEMGAKQAGDIKEICDLVHPHIGIVTAVGPQHLESFKTIENVQATKFELVDALPADGLAVINNDFEHVAARKVDNVRCVRYAVTAFGADYRAKDIVYSRGGTDFTVEGAGSEMRFHTRLVGECNVSNLVAAIIVAAHLGVPEDKIRRAVERIEPVEHRLSMKRTAGGVTVIDDAFNSNPSGAAMALDVLAAMDSGRRIIVTPGMIELGDRQYDLNFEFGAGIARSADVALVVGEYNREAIVEGIHSREDSSVEVIEVDSFAQAQVRLASIMKPGDTVLYENDLPDTFK